MANPSVPEGVQRAHAHGCTQNKTHKGYQLALRYLNERQFCDDSEFLHQYDCTYLDNLCDTEERGGRNFFRPTNCSKFPLKRAAPIYRDPSYLTAYHGTPSANIPSILKYGLLPAGWDLGGFVIPQRCGAALGPGVYTSPSPLYAQLYAPVEQWGQYYVQTVLMVRQLARNISHYRDEGCSTQSLIGRNDIWRLYGGKLKRGELQMKTTTPSDVVVQAVIVKIHARDPTQPGGEYDKVADVLRSLE
jgi:hypothetical protein